MAIMVAASPSVGHADQMDGISWLGHASFKIAKKEAPVVYLDPWKLPETPHDGDVILITHSHYDHLSVPDIQKAAKPGAVIIGPADCLKDLTGDVRPVKPGQQVVLEGVTIEAVPAYNTGKPFHPKENGWVGYIVTIGGRRIYHAGDTDVIPEMSSFVVDVALLPVSGTYVMSAEEAATAAGILNPKVAVPMHYGTIIGTENDARQFQRRCAPLTVKIYPAPFVSVSSRDSCCSRS